MNFWAQKKKSFWQTWMGLSMLFSIALHVLLIIAQVYPFGSSEAPTLEQAPIEITNIPPEILKQMLQQQQQPPKAKVNPREKEIAETEDANNNKVDPDAKFLSDRNQTAEKETKSNIIDDFRKKQGEGRKAKEVGKEDAPTGAETAEEETFKDLDVNDAPSLLPDPKNKGIKRDWKKLSLKDLGLGGDGGNLSATDDRLKGVDEGDRTILSTREFKFFSYYHRIKELLRQHWKPNVERKLTRMYEKGKVVGEDEMITRLQVLLSPDGRITRISTVTSSGIEEIDEAAVDAFNRASPFPNPPRGMLDADGFVRINWDFILKTEAAPRIQFSNAGRPPP